SFFSNHEYTYIYNCLSTYLFTHSFQIDTFKTRHICSIQNISEFFCKIINKYAFFIRCFIRISVDQLMLELNIQLDELNSMHKHLVVEHMNNVHLDPMYSIYDPK
uniref:GCP_C_terminal domain-containing protein n=1 Tax=Schistosoma curassoni TaxID=6186 RepID=A0A183JLX7_9TREM